MNTVVIFASPRKSGNTKKILDEFLSGCKGDYEIFYTADIKPKSCTGCGTCGNKKGKCIYDDLELLFDKIRNCDRLIIATPVYNYSFPSDMKAFADRLQPFFEMGLKNDFALKKGYLLCSCGCSGKFSVDVLTKQTKMIFDELGFDFFGKYFYTNTDKSDLTDINIIDIKAESRRFFG